MREFGIRCFQQRFSISTNDKLCFSLFVVVVYEWLELPQGTKSFSGAIWINLVFPSLLCTCALPFQFLPSFLVNNIAGCFGVNQHIFYNRFSKLDSFIYHTKNIHLQLRKHTHYHSSTYRILCLAHPLSHCALPLPFFVDSVLGSLLSVSYTYSQNGLGCGT